MASQRTISTYVFKQAGGIALRADVYRASDAADQPALLWLHGGALIFGSRGSIAPWQLERYLQAGYTVVAADYRLAPETKLPAIAEDLRDAYAWLRAEGPRLFGVDPERLAIVGHSAGAYLTLLAGCVVTPRPRALVSFYGYGDIVAPWYTEPSAFYREQGLIDREQAYAGVGRGVVSEGSFEARWPFYLYCRQHGLWPREVGGRDPEAEAEWFAPYCPVRQVTADYPPTLLLHGELDTDVPHEQSQGMAAALARAGVEHTLVSLPGYGHGFDRQGSEGDPVVASAFGQVLAFLREQGC